MAIPPGTTPPATQQRHWRAPCPGCGAIVEFQSPSAPVAVCSYCRSTVVRDGDVLRRIGVSAELIQDRSPLQLGASGTFNGRAFTLIGRQQLGYGDPKAPDGIWNEWHALFSDGKSGWLSDDNDQYVFAFDADPPAYVPPARDLTPGKELRIGGIRWSVASKVDARVLAAAGELALPPPLGRTFPVVDLRSEAQRVATLEYADPAKPRFSIGSPVRLADLRLRGVKDEQTAGPGVAGRAFACPNCGASVEVKLADTLSISCPNCASLIDLSRGIGAELAASKQSRSRKPSIPLGRSGTLSFGESINKSWQVVGFAVKEGGIGGPAPDRFNWYEYLLYNHEEGFAFLVDSEEGWTIYRTLTGVPADAGSAGGKSWAGVRYRRAEGYSARVTYVEGEYYWKVDKNQQLAVEDFHGVGTGYRERLSSERSAHEVVWSWGRILPATLVARAFAVSLPEKLAIGDVTPTSGSDVSLGQVVLWAAVIAFFLVARSCECDDDDQDCHSSGYRGSLFHK